MSMVGNSYTGGYGGQNATPSYGSSYSPSNLTSGLNQYAAGGGAVATPTNAAGVPVTTSTVSSTSIGTYLLYGVLAIVAIIAVKKLA